MKLSMNMTRTRRIGLACLLLCCGISALWGSFLEHGSSNAMLDFKGVYYFGRCLLQHSDPYKEGEPLRVYQEEGGDHLRPSDALRPVLALNMYLPSAFTFTVPFSMLPWGPAHLLWMTLTAVVFILSAFLVWQFAGNSSPGVSFFLTSILAANCEMFFYLGNPAGIVVSLCVVAIWCFLKDRFVPAGILCFAISLAIKPHDAGLVWLYFLLAGGVYRKRALQTLALTVALSLPAILWVTHVSLHWMGELHSNLLTASAPGGPINLGAASAITGSGPTMRIDLQSTISVFWNDPRFYNPVSYLVCAPLLLLGAFATLRSRPSPTRVWFAFAAIVPLTILVTYHCPYDAKLLLLTVPACAMLWAEGGTIAWLALLVNTAAIVATGDIPLTIFLIATKNIRISTAGLYEQILTVVLTRPIPLILLVMAIFYLWVYLRRDFDRVATAEPEEPRETPLALTPD
jgi:hypothetical protein